MRRALGPILAFLAGLLVLPVIVGALAFVGWLPSDSVSRPPTVEVAIGEYVLDASLEARAKGLRNPFAPDDTAALRAGANLFRQNCAGCHGGAHEDSPWGARNFYPRVPQFWRAEEDDMPTPEDAFVAVRDGVRYSGMGAWTGMMKETQMWQVANFVSRMHRLPPDIGQASHAAHH